MTLKAAAPDDMMAMQRAMSRKRWAEQNGLSEVAHSRGRRGDHSIRRDGAQRRRRCPVSLRRRDEPGAGGGADLPVRVGEALVAKRSALRRF